MLVVTRKNCRLASAFRYAVFLASLSIVVFVTLQSRWSTTYPYAFLMVTEEQLEPACQGAIASLLDRDTVLGVVRDIYDSHCSRNASVTDHRLLQKTYGCLFANFGKALLAKAAEVNKHLFTVQVGGMDGKSNDPMYAMFRTEKDLSSWLPAVFEPVKYNFHNLQETYQEMAEENSLSCALLAQQAITDDQSQTTCTFCYFDNSPDAPELCKEAQEWARLQLGTLQCDRYENFFRGRRDGCIIHEELPCHSLHASVHQWGLSLSDIAMLQVDIEGFELQMFEAMVNSQLQKQPQYALPPVIHFEIKVLKVRDRQDQTDALDRLVSILHNAGYLLFEDGEDVLGLLLQDDNTAKK